MVATVTLGLIGCIGSETPTTSIASDPMSLVSLDEQHAVVADDDAHTSPLSATGSLAPGAETAAAQRLPTERIELTPERREAIAAIRARAEQERQTAPATYPNVFEGPSLGDTAAKSTADVERIGENLAADATATQRSIDESDPSAYEDRAKWLWRLGRTHVRDTEAEIGSPSPVGQ